MSVKAILIGAGIGGLSAAISLRQHGVEVEVYERAAELREVGAGLSLWPNAVKALHRLGLQSELERFSMADHGAIRTADGEALMSMSAEEMRHRYGVHGIAMHRADLQRALLGRARQLGARIELGARLIAFDTDGPGARARFEGGATARADVLIGCDGLRSVVRAQLHGDRKPVYAGYTAWRCVVPFQRELAMPGESWGRGLRFGHVTLIDQRVYWFATRNAPEGQIPGEPPKSELRRTFADWHDPIPALVEAADEDMIFRNDIYDRPALGRWGRGPVTLLGDAAHPMTPNLGQGGCQAIEDAVVLGECLAGAANPEAGLRAYEARRIPRTRMLVERSRAIGRMGQWSNPLATALRNVFVRRFAARMRVLSLDRMLGFEV